MHFNIKHILQGDSRKEIARKINYNFDQIVSFAVGANGHRGPKGATGFNGPSGRRGATGHTGDRAALWFRQSTIPQSSLSNPGDLWIDDNTAVGAISYLDSNGSWNYSGYNLQSSAYFQAYSNTAGAAGVFEKYAIGFINSGGINEANTSLLISDAEGGLLDSNPNRSKLVISTSDQLTKPILSFIKSTRPSLGSPSFYWGSTGSVSNLIFKSDSSFTVNSYGSISVFSSPSISSPSLTTKPSLYFLGSLMNINTTGSTGSVNFIGDGDLNLYSNVTSGGGSFFSLSSPVLNITPTSISNSRPTTINTNNTYPSSRNCLYSSKFPVMTGSSISEGIKIDVSGSKHALLVQQPYPIGYYVNTFKVNPKAANSDGIIKVNGEVQIAQTVFGDSDYNATGGTGGGFFSHVRKITQINKSLTSTKAYPYYFTSQPSISSKSVFDLSDPSLWTSNVIIVNVTSSPNLYLKIPITLGSNHYIASSEFDYPTQPATATFRIMINTLSNSSKILGLVWGYYTPAQYTVGGVRNSGESSNLTAYNYALNTDSVLGTTNAFIQFPSLPISSANRLGCSTYVDLTWFFPEGKAKVFYKTSTGAAGFINLRFIDQ
jgi:hypothetical protein